MTVIKKKKSEQLDELIKNLLVRKNPHLLGLMFMQRSTAT